MRVKLNYDNKIHFDFTIFHSLKTLIFIKPKLIQKDPSTKTFKMEILVSFKFSQISIKAIRYYFKNGFNAVGHEFRHSCESTGAFLRPRSFPTRKPFAPEEAAWYARRGK
ncbi:MAG: hypothetical protein Ta2E_08910 [Mycoplasmoidaceae bacterium]|nr:MAG: hypothetical protein Ta2E_08910 [Mycoplasmoidaceae bacterium]